MIVFHYDKSFEGLLTSVFDAYFRKTFPDMLLAEGEIPPLFCNEVLTVYSNKDKADRVWNGIKKKLSSTALSMLMLCWLSELPGIDMILFRYIRKTIDASRSIELNFADPDVLELSKVAKKVSQERHRVIQFVRFQKTVDDVFFAAMEPLFNVLSLTTEHFKDRFSDQKWLIYDVKRQYGYYYDLAVVTEVTFPEKEVHFLTGVLDDSLMNRDERLFQKMWKEYFKSITIKERINPKLHRQHMPVRYWKYLTEKQK